MGRWNTRSIEVMGDVARVPLTRGHVAIIDAMDVPLVEGRDWSARETPRAVYAVGHEKVGDRFVLVQMHRVIMAAPSSRMVDHINGDGLDNRRANLRLATNSQNQHHRVSPSRATSGLIGATFHPHSGKWQARLRHEGGRILVGYFETAEEAHIAYLAKAAELRGEFAPDPLRTAPRRHRVLDGAAAGDKAIPRHEDRHRVPDEDRE